MNASPVDVDGFNAAYAGAVSFPALAPEGSEFTPEFRSHWQNQTRATLADELYGPIPDPPDALQVSRYPIAGEMAERLSIDLASGDRRFTVDAALWLPHGEGGPVPLICGLDFVGPIGVLLSEAFPIDHDARISPRPLHGAKDKRLVETLRGVAAYRWPIDMFLKAGYGVLVSCYGSWVPDDSDDWTSHGLYPLLDCANKPQTGAISLWAWAIMRLLDAAATCAEIDMSRVSVGGHSRLGKSALWAAANDVRIGAVLANNSGCGGSAPAAHPVGETFSKMAERFPHWTIQHLDRTEPEASFDQHHLLSLIAPRAVYLASAQDDLWADPIGSYMALQASERAWGTAPAGSTVWPSPQEVWTSLGRVRNGRLGYHLRPGAHDILPYDWRCFLNFLREAQETDG